MGLTTSIGRTVRERRIGLGLTTAQLGERAGVSKAMVSKVENARTSPSLATLENLAMALEIPITALFRSIDEEKGALFIPAGEGLRIIGPGDRADHKYELLGSNRGSYRRMEPMLVTLEAQTEVFPLYQHPGTEWIYMLAGHIEYGYGSARYRLKRGDALQFDGEVAHGPTAMIRIPARFVSVRAYGVPPETR